MSQISPPFCEKGIFNQTIRDWHGEFTAFRFPGTIMCHVQQIAVDRRPAQQIRTSTHCIHIFKPNPFTAWGNVPA